MSDTSPGEEPFDVPIRDRMIRLGQFLKLASLVGSGAEAKPVIAAGQVRVNGVVETRRGRQLVLGDVVAVHAMPDGAAGEVSERASASARVADEATYDDGLPW